MGFSLLLFSLILFFIVILAAFIGKQKNNDDPYEEDEWGIIDQVSQGIPRKEGQDFWKIPDRKEAIRLALTMAHEGDCVLVAGKGAEEVMMLRGKKVVWNDKKAIKELLKRDIKVDIGHDEWEKRENVCLT